MLNQPIPHIPEEKDEPRKPQKPKFIFRLKTADHYQHTLNLINKLQRYLARDEKTTPNN